MVVDNSIQAYGKLYPLFPITSTALKYQGCAKITGTPKQVLFVILIKFKIDVNGL